MSYLLDKKIQRKKFSYIISFVIICLLLFFFRSGIWNGLSHASSVIFRPIIVLGNNAGDKLRGLGSYFASKNSLYKENQNLKSKLNEDEALVINYNSVLADNADMKNILVRKDAKVPMTIASILSKPNQSLYDTLIIDAGTKQGLKTGNTVFALGNVPIGRIGDVYGSSAKVILFSSAGEKTQVIIGSKNLPAGRQGVFMEIVGRGGGNFEMIIPRDFTLTKGDQAVLPGITPYVLGVMETMLSDPRDAFTKALFISPVNIQELKFVEVEQ
jgi:cell shape-determining protein MreC